MCFVPGSAYPSGFDLFPFLLILKVLQHAKLLQPVSDSSSGGASGQLQRHIQKTCALLCLIICQDLHILKVNLRDPLEIHIAEYAAEAVHILVLAPASCRPFKDQDSDPVLSILKEWCQIKLRRCEGILRIADIAAIEPERKAGLHALKGNPDAALLPAVREPEGPDILPDGVVTLRNLSGLNRLQSIPWILSVHIGRLVVTLHLHVGRNRDFRPSTHVKVIFPKSIRRTAVILSIVKPPHPIQRTSEACLHILRPVLRCKRNMV